MIFMNKHLITMKKLILLLIFVAEAFTVKHVMIQKLENGKTDKVNYGGKKEPEITKEHQCTTCNCNRGNADCSNRNITMLPLDLTPNITTLDISSNYITVLKDNLLGSHYKNLKTLDLSNNQDIATLPKYAFHGLDELENLYIRSGSGIIVHPLIFQPFKKIKTIVVTGLGRRNLLGFPVSRNAWLKAFRGLQNSTIEKIVYDHISITTFILREIHLIHFKNCQLKYLHLPHNKITGLETGSLKYLLKLEILDLSQNMILALIPHSSWSFAIYLFRMVHLKKLKLDSSEARIKLQLNNPNVQTLENMELSLPVGLEEIYLSGTSLDHRPASLPYPVHFQRNNRIKVLIASNTYGVTYFGGPVKGLVNLETFIYNNNECEIVPEFFTCANGYFESLQVLDLAHNRIMLSHSRSNFTLFENCTKLVHLDISYNNLANVPFDILKDTYSLDSINLSGNKLEKFDVDLSKVSSLNMLNLSNNLLHDIGESSRNDIISAYKRSNDGLTVDLNGNPLICNCDAFPFINWMKDHTDIIYQGYDLTCQYINGSQVKFERLDVSHMRLECWKSIILASGLSMGLVLLVVGVIGYAYKRRHKILYAALHLRALLRRNNLPDTAFDFDGFLSYSSLDKTWAINNIYSSLAARYGYNICVDDRNFRPGSYISDIIVESISKSNKIILVITQNFLRSGWCKFELNLARGELATRGRDCLILILKEPIEVLPPELISPTLRSILETRVYLEWSEEEDRKLLFWRKLRDALGDPRFRGEEDTPFLYQNNDGDEEMLQLLT